MQINIDKKTGIFIGIIIFLLAVIGVLVVTNASKVTFPDNMRYGMGMSQSTSSNYTGADIMFLQMMIPHHQQAVDISNLALSKSQDPELLALAQTIAESQAAEIITMENWLNDAGASKDMGHAGHNMGGMLDSADLAKLETLTGSDFDKVWLAGMIEHHEGAIQMTNMIRDAKNPAIKAFGLEIIAVQASEIEQMKIMLAKIN
jgi:uncharacterized protein (DUF305 family)